MPARRGSGITRLFEADPDLLVHVDEAQVELARKHIVVSYVDVPKGVVEPPVLHAEPFDLGFLVLDGLLLRRVEFVGRRAMEVLGPGDVVRPWRPEPHFPSIPSQASWKVCEPARLAVLDQTFEREVARWPGVVSALLDRFDARSTSLAMQLALAQLPRLEVRLLCLLWHLADKFGRVEPAGVSLPLRLSQETLAALTSSRRPSISLALRTLGERKLVTRPRPGTWLLRGDPPAEMTRSSAGLVLATAAG